jgi:AcrR family transcriptional regulator
MSMRTRILEATSNLIRTEGMSAVTTKKIAAEAGCAEGSIFRNFGDKGGLLAAVLSFGLPETQTLYDTVDGATGSPDVRAGLTAIAEALLGFYRASYPLVGSALAAPCKRGSWCTASWNPSGRQAGCRRARTYRLRHLRWQARARTRCGWGWSTGRTVCRTAGKTWPRSSPTGCSLNSAGCRHERCRRRVEPQRPDPGHRRGLPPAIK